MKFPIEWIVPSLLATGLVVSVALRFGIESHPRANDTDSPLVVEEIEKVPDIQYTQFSQKQKGGLILDNGTIVFCQISFLGPDGWPVKSTETSGELRALPPVIRDMASKFGVGGSGFAIVPYSTFFPNGGGYPELPVDEEVRVNLEVKDAIPSGKSLNSSGKKIGLILIDMDKNGIAETLKGGDWEKGLKNDKWLDKNYTREVGVNSRLENREWVGPETGVFLTSRRLGKVEIEDLIGTYTGGIDWESGYDVLDQYDQNDNSILKGGELSGLFVWVDQNSNALVEDDEITPADEMFSTVALRPSELTGNKARRKDGVRFKDDSRAGTWEWKSRGSSP